MARFLPLRLLAAACALLLLGCETPADDDDDDAADDDDDDGGDCALEQQCGTVWGAVPSSGRVYVDASAEAGGDGSCGAPVTTLEEGLGLARSSGARSLAMAAGEWAGSWLIFNKADGNNDNGLDISGCGTGATVLSGLVDDGGTGQPVFEVTGWDTANVTLRDFSIDGGRRSIIVRGGAGKDGPIRVERVDINNPSRVGVIVHGFQTVAHLTDLSVTDPVPEDGIGWGVSIQTQAQGGVLVEQPTELEGVHVEGATGVGLVGDGGWLLITSSSVSGTLPLGAGLREEGRLGRGIQLQNRTMATLDTVTSSGNSDSAVFLHRPGRSMNPVEIVDSVLEATAAASVGETEETSGDGLSISQGGETQPAAGFPVDLEDSVVSGNPRAQVVAEGALLTLFGTNDFGSTGEYEIAEQLGGEVVLDGGAAPATVDTLGEGQELGLDRDPIAPDDFDEGGP